MGNHDLLSEEDFFSKLKPDSEIPEKDQDKKSSFEASDEDDIFKTYEPDEGEGEEQTINEIEYDEEPEPGEGLIIEDEQPFVESKDFHEDVQESLDIDQIEPEEEYTSEPENEALTEDYYDEKQDKINYKPIIVGISIVVFAIVVFIVLRQFVFNGSEESMVTEPEVVTDQAKLTPEEIQKANYLSNVAGRSHHELSFISNVINLSSSNTKISSILLYDAEFLFEVFSRNRNDLAKLNISLKDKFKNNKFAVVSSSDRPGKAGGVFGLYRLDLGGASPKVEVINSVASGEEAKRWLTSLINNNNLQLKNLRTKPAVTKNDFTITELDVNITGSLKNCSKLINDIAKAGKNIKIHKLTCNAVDQRTFREGKYQLKIIFKIYV